MSENNKQLAPNCLYPVFSRLSTAYSQTFLSTFLPFFLSFFLSSFLPSFLPSLLPSFLPSFLSTFLSSFTYLSHLYILTRQTCPFSISSADFGHRSDTPDANTLSGAWQTRVLFITAITVPQTLNDTTSSQSSIVFVLDVSSYFDFSKVKVAPVTFKLNQ